MPDSKLADLPAASSLVAGDLVYVVTDPAGTPTDRKVAIEDLLAAALETGGVGTGTALSGFVDLAGQTRTMFRATSVGTSQNPIVAIKAGRIVGLSVVSTAARTAGAATFTALVNAADQAVSVAIDGTTPQYAHVTGVAPFAAGDHLQVRHTDVGFTPATNFEATLWVEYST